VAPADFAAVARAFFAEGGAGANVTLPHKGAALALADGASAAARRAGSANVLARRADGSLAADNTDGIGLVRDLTVRHGYVLSDRRCLLLGAGGAARGVAGPLLDAGLAQLIIANRSPAAAIALADAIDDPQRAQASAWEMLATLGRFDVIVHATAAGVLGQPLALPGTLADARTLAYDLAYGGAAQPFLAWARAAGATRAVDGLGMLVEQAAEAFHLWHGVRPDTEAVHAELRATY
jgi:shikimate dehydrogenase